MLLDQNGKCAICDRDATHFKRKLSVDHDHRTGKIRGLLCMRCNIKIGHFENFSLFLDKMKQYLDKDKSDAIV
jgi:hypothetical protein